MDDKLKMRFLCAVSDNCQIFIPVGLQKTASIGPKDVVQLDLHEDGSISFSKSLEDSTREHGQEKKAADDTEKAQTSQ